MDPSWVMGWIYMADTRVWLSLKTPLCWENLNCTVPGRASGKELAYQCRRCKRHRFDPWVRKIPWRRKWQLTPVFLPGESHGKRSLQYMGLQRVRHDWEQHPGKIMSLITLENWPGGLMKNANISFPLKIVIGMEQIGSGNQKYAGSHLMELNISEAPIYSHGFHQDG